MILHVLLRIVLVVAGYMAAIIAASIVFPLSLLLISQALPDSKLWDWLGLGPLALVLFPVLFVFMISVIVAMTLVQAIIVNLATEALALRNPWLHLALALVVSLSGALLFNPSWFTAMGSTEILITLAAAAASLVGGLVHWAIAGRNAGFLQRPA